MPPSALSCVKMAEAKTEDAVCATPGGGEILVERDAISGGGAGIWCCCSITREFMSLTRGGSESLFKRKVSSPDAEADGVIWLLIVGLLVRLLVSNLFDGDLDIVTVPFVSISVGR